MANQWFRMYAEFASDPKVQMLSEVNQRRLIMVFCLRCNDDVTLQDDEIAFQLRISNEEWLSTKAVFVSKGMLTEGNEVVNWDKRQFVSDSSAARVAKHREAKKRVCNVTVTPPEAEADTDTEGKPLFERWEVNGTTAAQNPPPLPSRRGLVCGLLRKAGMADAAPHYLTDETWDSLLAKRTDEEIVEVAKAKMAAKPNQRIGLKYIAPALLADPDPITPSARGSPRQTLTESRTETLAGLTGRTQKPPKETPHHDAIESTAVRIAG